MARGEDPDGRRDELPTEDFLDDEELDAWIEADEAADRDAADLLRRALAAERGAAPPQDELSAAARRLRAGLDQGGHPYDWIRSGAGFVGPPPSDDAELVLESLLATMVPRGETGLHPEEESLIVSMERADWLGAIVELVRAGPGARARPEDLVRAIAECPEVVVAGDWDPDDDTLTETTFELVSWPWHVAGALDEDRRLTALGAWALPRALARAWGADFDTGEAV